MAANVALAPPPVQFSPASAAAAGLQQQQQSPLRQRPVAAASAAPAPGSPRAAEQQPLFRCWEEAAPQAGSPHAEAQPASASESSCALQVVLIEGARSAADGPEAAAGRSAVPAPAPELARQAATSTTATGGGVEAHGCAPATAAAVRGVALPPPPQLAPAATDAPAELCDAGVQTSAPEGAAAGISGVAAAAVDNDGTPGERKPSFSGVESESSRASVLSVSDYMLPARGRRLRQSYGNPLFHHLPAHAPRPPAHADAAQVTCFLCLLHG